MKKLKVQTVGAWRLFMPTANVYVEPIAHDVEVDEAGELELIEDGRVLVLGVGDVREEAILAHKAGTRAPAPQTAPAPEPESDSDMPEPGKRRRHSKRMAD